MARKRKQPEPQECRVNFTLPRALLQLLDKVAAINERTRSHEIRYALKQHLKAE